MTKQEYENEIKELKERLERLETEKIEEPLSKRWKPEYNETYYVVVSQEDITDYIWDGGYFDKWSYLTGNCFKTKEEAEEHKKQIEYTARYKNYIEEHNEPIDWNNQLQNKFAVYYDCSDKIIDVEQVKTYKDQGTIYASSEGILWDAIKEIGEDNFKKYVLGVK